MPQNVSIVILVLILFIGLLYLLLTQILYRTTNAELSEALQTLETKIAHARALVGQYNPHSARCQIQLAAARDCLTFRSSSRLVVTASMMLKRRNEGIEIAKKLIASFDGCKDTACINASNSELKASHTHVSSREQKQTCHCLARFNPDSLLEHNYGCLHYDQSRKGIVFSKAMKRQYRMDVSMAKHHAQIAANVNLD